MLVKDDPSLSTSEIALLKQKIESKNLETVYLQQQIAQKNQEIVNLRQELKHKKKSFFAGVKQKIKSLIRHEIPEDNLARGTQYVLQYPEIVLIKASPLFDSEWYLAQYQDARFSGMEPAQHYLQLGAKKGYDPSPNFSTRDYLSLYPDAQQMNPLAHYEVFGKAEGRSCKIEKETSSFLLEKEIKVIFISGDPDTPGHTYRISRYANAVKAMGAAITELSVTSAFDNLDEIFSANVLIVWRATWGHQLASIYAAARKAKIPIIFDIDDLLIDPNLAKIEIVDGIRTTGSTERAAADFFELLQISMEKADYCSAPTNFLAKYMCSLGKRTFHLPNGFDEHVWYASRLALRKRLASYHDGLIRIGYAGGSRTHQKDFAKIADVIARLLRARPNCRLVLFRKGSLPCTDIEEFPALVAVSQQIEWRELVPLHELPREMARFDINIAPLDVGNAFCEAKSELKFFESALVEVPIVASPTQTFREAIEDGKTGFLASDENSWQNILSKLLDDASLRKQIGRCAYYSVLWKFGSEHRIELLSSMIDMVFYSGSRAARAFELNLLKSKNASQTMPIIPAHEIIFYDDKLNPAEVTIVVPCYNLSHYLIEKLESVKDQTLFNLDLVIVDDCSTDNSIEIASQWISEHKDRFNRVMLIKNIVNSGLGLTKNVGFFNAETLFVIPLDPDKKLMANFAATCLTKIKETSAAFVYPNIQRVGEDKSAMAAQAYDPMLFTCGNYVDAMALIRLSAWAYVGGYHHLEFGWEDYDFWCRFVEHGLFGYHVDEILATYGVHDKSKWGRVSRPETKAKIRADIGKSHPWLNCFNYKKIKKNRELQIGIFGTFDVKNYGDLLFPLIAEFELRKRLVAVKIHPFSYHAKTSSNWIYKVNALADLPALASDLDGALIGGGHIIRFDKYVAPGYGPPTPDIHHPTGYWLVPILTALQYGIPVIWNSAGVYGEIPEWAKPLLNLALEQSDYIAVRDEWAKELLEQFAPTLCSGVDVKPDTAFAIASLFPCNKPSADYLHLRESLGLTRPYIIIQATSGLDSFGNLVRDNPQFFSNYQIVAISTAPVCGDSPAFLEKHLKDFISLQEWPSPALMAELIHGAEAVVGVSLHLSITALAYGVPVFRPINLANRKFSVLSKFDSVYQFENQQPISLEWFSARLGRKNISGAVSVALDQLKVYWDHVAMLFKTDRQYKALPALAKMWQTLPVTLENHSTEREKLHREINERYQFISAENEKWRQEINNRDALIYQIYKDIK